MKVPEWKIERIKKMSKEGLNQYEIAEALNLSQTTVSKYDPRKPGKGKRKYLGD